MFETTYHEADESYYSVKCDEHIGNEYDPRLQELADVFCQLEFVEDPKYTKHYLPRLF